MVYPLSQPDAPSATILQRISSSNCKETEDLSLQLTPPSLWPSSQQNQIFLVHREGSRLSFTLSRFQEFPDASREGISLLVLLRQGYSTHSLCVSPSFSKMQVQSCPSLVWNCTAQKLKKKIELQAFLGFRGGLVDPGVKIQIAQIILTFLAQE